MAEAWLSIIGMGDSADTLPPASHAALAAAQYVFGAPRHLALAGLTEDPRAHPWPVPFSAAPVLALRGTPVAVLASGDPFWFGAGAVLAAYLTPGEWHAHPAPSTFSLAAARLGWRIEDTPCLGLHAAPFERLVPIMGAGQRALCLLRDAAAPAALAQWLTAHRLGDTQITVLEALAGPRERIRTATAASFALTDIAPPVAAALAFAGAPALPRCGGLPDDLFHHDGQISKRPIRALALSALAPRPGELLWDLGAGSGSIGIEWALAGGRTIAVEQNPTRAANIRANAEALGVAYRVDTIEADHTQWLAQTPPTPAAVFIGGGASAALLETLWTHLPPSTRLVLHGVTLETEMLLAEAHARHGGDLLRIELARAEPLGRMRGWLPARPVVQWSVTR